MIDYRSIGYDNRTELSWAHELHDHKNIVSASMKTLQSMAQHGLEITRLLLENIYDVRLLNHVSSINSIINIILSANKVNIDVNVGYPRFHQTGLGIHSKYNLDILLLLFEHGLQSHRYGDIQDFDLIVGPNGWHVSQFSTEQAEAGIPDHLIQYEPIHSLTKINPYGSRRTPLQEPKTLYHLCEPDVLPQANNPYHVESIRKLWMDTIKLQKAQQNLSFAKGMKDPDSYIYDIPEPKLFETIGGPGRGSSKKAAQALRRQSVGRLSGKKELFDAQQRLEAAKMLYPGEGDESYAFAPLSFYEQAMPYDPPKVTYESVQLDGTFRFLDDTLEHELTQIYSGSTLFYIKENAYAREQAIVDDFVSRISDRWVEELGDGKTQYNYFWEDNRKYIQND